MFNEIKHTVHAVITSVRFTETLTTHTPDTVTLAVVLSLQYIPQVVGRVSQRVRMQVEEWQRVRIVP